MPIANSTIGYGLQILLIIVMGIVCNMREVKWNHC